MMIRMGRSALATLVFALVAPTASWGQSPTSTNYALPSSVVNNGIGDMASTSYKLSSSVGDADGVDRLLKGEPRLGDAEVTLEQGIGKRISEI